MQQHTNLGGLFYEFAELPEWAVLARLCSDLHCALKDKKSTDINDKGLCDKLFFLRSLSVSVVTEERSFYKLKVIKTYLRLTMAVIFGQFVHWERSCIYHQQVRSCSLVCNVKGPQGFVLIFELHFPSSCLLCLTEPYRRKAQKSCCLKALKTFHIYILQAFI